MENKFFKVSSGLKNLIGSELITDNFVAVFELVKNSFDAQATEVKITFENIYSKEAKIIIQDNGKGMTYDDLDNKWLFLGYSAKRDGTEDEDYRNKIKSGRIYAGSKGVGRFSCDRLGRYLSLVTIGRKANSKIEKIFVDWAKFEKNQKELFQKIPVEHTVLRQNPYSIKHGTVLEITGVQKDFWNRDNFKKLKEKLSKLVRPDLNASGDVQKFKIILSVPDELDKDKEVLFAAKKQQASEIHQYYNTTNGEIKNFVFNELDIKTTKIEADIDDSGIITTKLFDRDNFIYEIKEKSEFDLLSNIQITLYFLNRSAKVTFHKRTGVEHVDFGSLFIYRNGFRIYPYGERGDDSLRLENRALQGYARFIGLRSLIGEISIDGSVNQDLRETTSRGNGLVKTKAYEQLVNTDDGFLIKTLRRLERYVVDVTQWGVNNDDENIDISSKKAIEGLVKLVANISDKQTVELKYNSDILDLLATKEEKSAPKLVQNFKRIAAESNDKKLYKEAEKIEKAIASSLKRANSAEIERDIKVQEKRDLQNKLDHVVSQNNFLQKDISDDTKNLESILHHIGLTTNLIKTDIENLVKAINNKSPKNELVDIVKRLSRQNEKITSFSKYFKKVNFNIHTNKLDVDIVSFANEYLENVYKLRDDLRNNRELLKVKINTPANLVYKTKISPIDIIIVLDNLVSNSFKNGATTIELTWSKTGDSVRLSFKDDGKGINSSILSNIFDFGFTTSRRGSGIGLYHVKEIIEKMKGKIIANNSLNKGVEFIISF